MRADTRWWQEYVQTADFRSSRGRLKFDNSQNAAPFPRVMIIFRPPPCIPTAEIAAEAAWQPLGWMHLHTSRFLRDALISSGHRRLAGAFQKNGRHHIGVDGGEHDAHHLEV
jgi:hypothetical protein